jgi:hypothetical protein
LKEKVGREDKHMVEDKGGDILFGNPLRRRVKDDEKMEIWS